MKRGIFILLLMCIATLSLRAQQILSVEQTTDSIIVVYEYPIEYVATDYQLSFTPAICAAEHQLRLPEQTIYGDHRIRVLHRDFVLNAPKEQVEPNYTRAADMPETMTDTIAIARRGYQWLLTDSLTLCLLNMQRIGCCRTTDYGDTCGLQYAYLAPNDMPIVIEEEATDTIEDIIESNPHYVGGLAVTPILPESVKRLRSGVLRDVLDYRPYTAMEALAKDSEALTVYFELDKIELKPWFRDNKVILDSIIYLVGELIADTTAELKKVQIVGLASVEGPERHNLDLAGNRAKALKQYIQHRYPQLSNQQFELNNGGEGWADLRYGVMMAEPFDGQQDVINIIDNQRDPERRERLIKALNGGETYQYMLEHILINQRNSGYLRVYYDVTNDIARVINMAIKKMEDADDLDELVDQILMYREAAKMLQIVDRDPRSWNALGSALWLSGEWETARYWWERASRHDDPDSKINLKNTEEYLIY